MLAQWLENDDLYSKTDRLMGVIYSLRITDRRTLQIVTGWNEMQIHGGLQRIRNMGGRNEKDKWLRAWQPTHRSNYVYTLGEKGIQHVRAIKDNALGYEEQELAIRGQITHFMGTNQILVRVIEAGLPFQNWYSSKDTMSYLHYQIRPFNSPVNPDALLKLEHGDYFLEFDTGTENGGKIENKIHRYMMLAVMVGEMPPIVWVTRKQSRVGLISRNAHGAVNTYLTKMAKEIKKRNLPERLPAIMPKMYVFFEGEEIDFLSGAVKMESILK